MGFFDEEEDGYDEHGGIVGHWGNVFHWGVKSDGCQGGPPTEE